MQPGNPSQPLIIPINGHTPKIHPTAWIAPNATIIGDVEIGPDSSVFYGCVLRGDIGPIRIGARTNIQDNSTMHGDADAPCILGDDVTVGHMALLHGTTVGNGTLVGMKATLLTTVLWAKVPLWRRVQSCSSTVKFPTVLLPLGCRRRSAGNSAPKNPRRSSPTQAATWRPHACTPNSWPTWRRAFKR